MRQRKDGSRLVVVVLGLVVVPFGSIVDVVRTWGVGRVHRWGRRVAGSCIVDVTYWW